MYQRRVYSQGTNTIQGCYSNGNGSLRRVNFPSECNNSETPISWSVTGPQGPQGIQGPIGPQGPPGLDTLNDHHKELNFLLNSGQSQTIVLPKPDTPIHVTIGIFNVIQNGQAQPPITLRTWYLLDSATGTIGGDGDQIAGDSNNNYVVSLTLNGGTLAITTNPNPDNPTPITSQIKYSVQMWY